jgi:histone deacetylase 11
MLQDKLPEFLDSLSKRRSIELAIYNAGTDVVTGDPLGNLELSPDDVLERDLFVVDQLRSRGIPVVLLPSGGYTQGSCQLIAATVGELIIKYAKD